VTPGDRYAYPTSDTFETGDNYTFTRTSSTSCHLPAAEGPRRGAPTLRTSAAFRDVRDGEVGLLTK